MDFGRALANFRNPAMRARVPRLKRRKLTGSGPFRAGVGVNQIRYKGKCRIATPGTRVRQVGLHPAEKRLPRLPRQAGERTVVDLREDGETT